MNILITLPKHLLDKIISGEKKYEMRKCLPKNMKLGEDGFFVVEKGTDIVRCWCRLDQAIEVIMTEHLAIEYSRSLCVTPQYVINYAPAGTKVYLWAIGKLIKFQDLRRNSLIVDRNPQSFYYCSLSYGESF